RSILSLVPRHPSSSATFPDFLRSCPRSSPASSFDAFLCPRSCLGFRVSPSL
ncbi:hypothetical protein TGVAND_204395B, partial [Toxoplasma gondii VAND]